MYAYRVSCFDGTIHLNIAPSPTLPYQVSAKIYTGSQVRPHTLFTNAKIRSYANAITSYGMVVQVSSQELDLGTLEINVASSLTGTVQDAF
jgi:hypothetical protein